MLKSANQSLLRSHSVNSGRFFALACEDGTARVYDADEDFELVAILRGSSRRIVCVTWNHPNFGQLLVLACSSNFCSQLVLAQFGRHLSTRSSFVGRCHYPQTRCQRIVALQSACRLMLKSSSKLASSGQSSARQTASSLLVILTAF